MYWNEGDILEEALAREISMLLEEQPGVLFEKHLDTRRKQFIKEGAHIKLIMSKLLREASPGHSTATTLQFFAELATHRGFVGVEVDETWAYLKKSYSKEMVLASCRRAPKLLLTHLGRAIAEVGRDFRAQHRTNTQHEATIVNLQAELSEVKKEVKAAEAANSDIRSEADISRWAAAEQDAKLRSALAMSKKTEEISAKKAADVASVLADVEQLLADQREETAAAGVVVEAVNAELQAVRMEARDDTLAMTETHRERLAALSSGHMKEVQHVSLELADVQNQLLDVQRNATAAVVTAAEAAKLEINALRSEVHEARHAEQKADEERDLVEVKLHAAEEKLRKCFDSTSDKAQREWRRERLKAMGDLDACKVRGDERLVRLDIMTEELERTQKQLDEVAAWVYSQEQELETCNEQLASLRSGDGQ